VKFFAVFIIILLFPYMLLAQNDCVDAITVCGNNNFSGLDATGIGIQELSPDTNPCFSQENNSLWLKLLIKNGGTLGFNLIPESPDIEVDFDFWIFGPNVSCDSIGSAVRCSTTNPLASGATTNVTGMNATETTVSEGPSWLGFGFISHMQVQDGEVYYLLVDRPHGSANFSIQWTGTATFHDVPVFNNPLNIPLKQQRCDTDGTSDATASFNLKLHAVMLLGTQTQVTLTFHEDLNGAVTGSDAIADPEHYLNTSILQTIYMRMTNDVTGCFVTESFDIEVLGPFFNNPLNLSLDIHQCGPGQTAAFNLTKHAAMLLDNQPTVLLTYHTSLNDALLGNAPIINKTAFVNTSNPQTIYMRMADPATGCQAVKPFIIQLHKDPVFINPLNIPLKLDECDTDGTDDGTFAFNLTRNAAMLTGTQPFVAITYYDNITDAVAGTNQIANPTAYTNTGNPQTIYMRMTNTLAGCFINGSFIIEAHSLPAFNNPANISLNLEACDTDGVADQSFDFNLEQHAAMLKGSQANVALTFYEDANDAIAGTGAIANTTAYANNANPQTVHMRLTNTVTGCFVTGQFTLKVNSLPVFMNPAGISLKLDACDDDGTADMVTPFDLTRHKAMLLGSQANTTLTYYSNPAAAAMGTGAISNETAYSNTANPQVIYMRMENTATGCINITSFMIEVHGPPVFNNPQKISIDLEQCDTDGTDDLFFSFDLTTHAAMLQGSQNGIVISYHESQNSANLGTAAISNPAAYTNTANPQTLYIRIAHTASGCFATLPFSIRAHHVPVFNNPQNLPLKLEECDSDTFDDKSFTFNLNENATMLKGNQANVVLTYYEHSADAAAGTNFIANPAAYANTANPQTIYMRMQNAVTGCYTTGSFDIEVVELLNAGQPASLALCDVNKNGFRIFDLSQNDDVLKNGDPNTFVRYYLSQSDAENEVNPISVNYQNTQPYVPQTIWARLENTTGCFGHDIKSFTISILRLPDIVYSLTVIDFTDRENSITVVMDNAADYEFSLDGDTYTDDPVFNNLLPGLYTLYIRAKNECKEVSVEVAVLQYPKFFTPNGDGINEYWQVRYLFLQPGATVAIFDRYGKLITSFKGDSTGWDGTYNGRALPATDYWFVLTLESGRIIKGHFSLIR
jgi:gliding motility-associated-like protein